jgi:hypothetical protein
MMEFRKARLRTPQDWEQFQSATISRRDDGWVKEGPLKPKRGKRSEEVDQIRRAFVAAHERLADAVDKTIGFDGKSVKKVHVDTIRDELRSRGFLETKQKTGGLTATARSHWRRAKTSLLDSGKWVEKDGLIWRV